MTRSVVPELDALLEGDTYYQNPYPAFARLREERPVHWHAPSRSWLVASWQDVEGAVIASHTVCYDMSYSKAATPFVSWSIEQGCARAHKGWGMLVEQAAESFLLWRGVRPDTKPVLKAILGSAPAS